jgi:hypothetical protein
MAPASENAATHINSTSKARQGRWVAAVVVVILFAAYLLLHPRTTARDPLSQRIRNLNRIGNALNHYVEDHNGAWPDRLSQLVPEYVHSSNVNWFFWPNRNSHTITSLPFEARARMIDQEGAYVYLGTNGFNQNMVLFERQRPPATRDSGGGVVILRTNLLIQIRSVREMNSTPHP